MNGRRSVTIASCRSPVAVADIFHAARLFAYDKMDVPCCLALALAMLQQLTLRAPLRLPASAA